MARDNESGEEQPRTEAEILEFRKVGARLMAPFMFQGIEVAGQYAEENGIYDPAARYSLLMGVSSGLLRWPESRQAYSARYSEFAAHFTSREHHESIYDNQLPRLIVPAVQDAYKAGYGAGRFLEAQGRGAEAAEIIPRSMGLLAVSRVSKVGALEINGRLGYPIASQHFCLTSIDTEEVVGFTPEAQAIIAEYPSPYGGCAAYNVEDPRPSGTAPNLLVAYWQEVSAYAFAGSAA